MREVFWLKEFGVDWWLFPAGLGVFWWLFGIEMAGFVWW